MTAKRLFDLTATLTALMLLWPVLLAATIGIKLSDRGPALYRARRMGRNRQPFVMYKFRTMRVVQDNKSAITSKEDTRIFPLGRLLRKLKIDELPQLLNVLRGEMSIVGPRPEAVSIVERFYRPEHMATLDVPPGLAGPGSIYNYTHGEAMIGEADPERDYAEKLLPIKLGLELVYVHKASLFYDLSLIVRTALVIVSIALGRTQFPEPPEYREALHSRLYPISL